MIVYLANVFNSFEFLCVCVSAHVGPYREPGISIEGDVMQAEITFTTSFPVQMPFISFPCLNFSGWDYLCRVE